MGLNISFFKTPRHRVFHYEPLYYNKRKEHIDEVLEEIKKKKGEATEDDPKRVRYYSGKNIRGKMRNYTQNNSRHAMHSSTNKIIGIISLIILFVLIYYFAEYFGILISGISR